jgi:hypothetical protein
VTSSVTPLPEPDSHGSIRIIERVSRKRHQCPLPRWRKRRQLDLGRGSIVRCTECGKLWRWTGDQSGNWWTPEHRDERRDVQFTGRRPDARKGL